MKNKKIVINLLNQLGITEYKYWEHSNKIYFFNLTNLQIEILKELGMNTYKGVFILYAERKDINQPFTFYLKLIDNETENNVEKEVIVLKFRKVIFANEDDAHEIGKKIEQLSDDLVEYIGYYLDDNLKENAEEWN